MLRLSAIATILTALLLTVGCGGSWHEDGGSSLLLEQLDSVMTVHDTYIANKEKRIEALRSLDRGLDATARYNLYDKLYSEYYSYDFDSAAHYAGLKLKAAMQIGNREKAGIALLNGARAALSRGREADALEMLKTAVPDTIYRPVRLLYYDAAIAYREMRGDSTADIYTRLLADIDSPSVTWVYSECARLREAGRLKEALSVMTRHHGILEADRRNRAISHYLTGRLHLDMGDTVAALNDMTISAINDVMTPVRDYSSLYQLATLLFATGDIDRAYRYINFAVKDHNAANVRNNLIASEKVMPAIVAAYDMRNKARNASQRNLLTGIGLLALLLAAALVWAFQSRRRATATAAEEAKLNQQLHVANRHLSAVNQALNESNKVKEAYIVQYLNLCSYYIECVDRYRADLRATARDKGMTELLSKLNSTSYNDKDCANFIPVSTRLSCACSPTLWSNSTGCCNPTSV